MGDPEKEAGGAEAGEGGLRGLTPEADVCLGAGRVRPEDSDSSFCGAVRLLSRGRSGRGGLRATALLLTDRPAWAAL